MKKLNFFCELEWHYEKPDAICIQNIYSFTFIINADWLPESAIDQYIVNNHYIRYSASDSTENTTIFRHKYINQHWKETGSLKKE